jgi:crotonobetainyl-CoA:carnitine CoA-transferase CaiB-like acyl-CoA transferase
VSGSAEPHRVDFLAGVRVLELGDGVAGAAATSVLWALGADVTAVIDPESTHRRGRPQVDRDGLTVSLLSIVLDRGKHLVTIGGAGELEELLARDYDLVIVDRVAGVRGALAPVHDIGAYAEVVAATNRRAWVTISAFGLTRDRAGDIGTELTVAAAGGMLATARDERTGQPLKLAGQQSLLNAGQSAALAACHALDLAERDGCVHLDLSAVEATIATGPTLEVGNLSLATGSPGGARRYGAPASFYECNDGQIRISAMEDHQWEGVVDAMGAPTWTERFDSVEMRIEGADEIDEHIAEWTRARSKVEVEALLQARGVPATAMYTPAELLESPQLTYRAAFDPLPVDGSEARVVGLPFRIVEGGNGRPHGGERRRRSLRGLRILEAGRVLAVPLAGALLGALGAEVTKLEDLTRLDMYRRRGPYIDGEAGAERGAYFALMNHSKLSAAFDVDAERERLDALLDRSDVVIENLGPKRASAIGLGASSAPTTRPDLLAVSSSGFGMDGPHASYRAYAYNLQASCGLGYLTRNDDGEPAEIDIAWADLISAYTLATIIAAWAVGPSGNRGAGIDFSMSDLVVAHFNEFLAAASLDPDSDRSVDRANELLPYAPHGVYATADGWVALAIADDEEFDRLVKVLECDALSVPKFTTAIGRFEARGTLDAHIAETFRTRVARDLAAELRAVGIAAEEVMSAPGLLSSVHLASRGFLTEVEHPTWGRRRLVGIPWRPFGEPALVLRPPPLLEDLDSPERDR